MTTGFHKPATHRVKVFHVHSTGVHMRSMSTIEELVTDTIFKEDS